MEQSVNLVKTRKKEEVKDRAETIVEEIILDALIPPIKTAPKSPTQTYSTGETESGEAVISEEELNASEHYDFEGYIRK